jgi:hypothetical protein
VYSKKLVSKQALAIEMCCIIIEDHQTNFLYQCVELDTKYLCSE